MRAPTLCARRGPETENLGYGDRVQRDGRCGVIVNVSSDEAFVQWDDGKTGWTMLAKLERETRTFFRIRSVATGDLAALRFGGSESAEKFMRAQRWPRDQYVIETETIA